jgi:hypothetical protein
MPLLRPLDPTFPIERQLSVDARPVVMVNVITLDKADEQAFLHTWQDDAVFHETAAGLHLDPAAPCDWRKPDIPQLLRLGINR